MAKKNAFKYKTLKQLEKMTKGELEKYKERLLAHEDKQKDIAKLIKDTTPKKGRK